MRGFSSYTPLALLLTILGASITLPDTATAQAGYLFKPPVATLSIRLGTAAPSAKGDLFDFFTDELTLERGDFRTFAFAADLGLRVRPKLDIVIGTAFDQSSNRSEFQEWTDQDDMPIEQTTELSRVPLTLSARFYPVERGRAIGRHAWVPTTLAPYITAGAGIMFYELEQFGDFVDHETLEVFSSRLQSSGNGTTAHVGVGGEWWLTTRFGINAEARYAWGSAGLERDFADFDRIDLRGIQLTTGLAVRF